MLLEGKKLLITGITTDDSIAFYAARVAQEQGAEIVVTGFGRAMRLTERAAHRLPAPPGFWNSTSNDPRTWTPSSMSSTSAGAVSTVLCTPSPLLPADALGGNFLNTPAESASTAFLTSAFSLKTLAVGMLPLLQKAGGGSVVGLDFDNRMAWPAYDWMGVAKSALQSVCRYLARDLGQHRVRVNLVSAGPLKTVAAKSIPGFDLLHDMWSERAPLKWDSSNPEPVARMVCVLLSDWAPMTTGEVIHVDGGFHAIAAPAPPDAQDLTRRSS